MVGCYRVLSKRGQGGGTKYPLGFQTVGEANHFGSFHRRQGDRTAAFRLPH